jgi:hypothetical protein
MTTTARTQGGNWVLDGEKTWITNGGLADVALVWARTADGIRGFLVERGAPGFTTTDIHGKLSMRASVTFPKNQYFSGPKACAPRSIVSLRLDTALGGVFSAPQWIATKRRGATRSSEGNSITGLSLHTSSYKRSSRG